MSEICNIAQALVDKALLQPNAIALHYPNGYARDASVVYRSLTYAELDTQSNHTAAALAHAGITRGMRTAVMVRPGGELFVLMYALFKLGAVPVLIDPGIDRRALKACLDETAPEAFIGIALAQAARLLLGWARHSVRIVIHVGARWIFGGLVLDTLRAQVSERHFVPAPTRASELAAILFTSGATGVPKGVEYLHGHFAAQIEMLRNAFAITPGMINMPTFPPFALFDPALGVTSVIPDMDPTRPAQVDPQKLIAAIERFQVSLIFGSPALLDRLSRYAMAQGIQLTSIQRVISAGAPVAPSIVERIRRVLPDTAHVFTPYGATECLPVSIIESRRILEDTRYLSEQGAGTCVGFPAPGNQVRIIPISDRVISNWSELATLPSGEIGEITVIGPTSTEAYHARPQATALAKIPEGEHLVHRMGDLGYFDAEGKLWFCGRMTQRVVTQSNVMHTEQVEPIFNTHLDVKRSALVGIGKRGEQTPVICIELEPSVHFDARERTAAELLNMAARYPHTQCIQHVLFHPGFPVDIRHNAKIGREKLAAWVARELRR